MKLINICLMLCTIILVSLTFKIISVEGFFFGRKKKRYKKRKKDREAQERKTKMLAIQRKSTNDMYNKITEASRKIVNSMNCITGYPCG